MISDDHFINHSSRISLMGAAKHSGCSFHDFEEIMAEKAPDEPTNTTIEKRWESIKERIPGETIAIMGTLCYLARESDPESYNNLCHSLEDELNGEEYVEMKLSLLNSKDHHRFAKTKTFFTICIYTIIL